MLKNEKGITFLVCIITIVVLIIIGAAITATGISTYKNSKVKIFASEMKMIQEKINLYSDRSAVDSSIDIKAIGCAVNDTEQATYEEMSGWINNYKSLSEENETYINDNINYLRYIDSTTESVDLGLKDISRPVIYDYHNKKLFSIEPVEYKGKNCYTLEEINSK